MDVTEANAAEVAIIQRRLLRPFDPKSVKWKPTMVKNNRAMALAYIDARLVMDRLDRVVHVGGWRDEYTVLPSGEVECRLSVKIGGQWITKADVGSQSEQPDGGDRMKAAYSDALKRAAVKFGIGRYLYRLPQQWVDYDPVRKRITQTPTLPAFAVPDGPEPVEEPDADEPAEPKADAPPPAKSGPFQKPAADNHALRAKIAQMCAQAKTHAEAKGVCDRIVDDSRAGLLSDADRAALRPIAREMMERCPPPAQPAAH